MDEKSDITSSDITGLLNDLSGGDESVLDQLLPAVYGELRRIAAFQMSGERGSHTLQPTALVHETYLKLIDQRQANWKNRSYFFGLASQIMRRILVSHARRHLAEKRGGAQQQVSLSIAVNSFEKPQLDILALNEALENLAEIDERKSRIVEMKFFGGLKTKEIAEVLSISVATVEREWSFAKAWLYDEIQE